MTDFLPRITEARRAEARARTADGAMEHAEQALPDAPPPRDLAAALGADGLQVIAEIKRASPSAGAIVADIDPVAIARAYQHGGAAAISVLTEPDHFHGSLHDLRAVRGAVALPVLRKDFNCEPLHVLEARASGADAVLLIVAALTGGELASLRALTEDIGMTALVEVHAEHEVPLAIDAGARVIGINTRDLVTLAVDASVVERVRPSIPAGVLVVGESGIKSRADAEAMERAGCDAVLVGESLMRAPDPAAALRALRGEG